MLVSADFTQGFGSKETKFISELPVHQSEYQHSCVSFREGAKVPKCGRQNGEGGEFYSLDLDRLQDTGSCPSVVSSLVKA